MMEYKDNVTSMSLKEPLKKIKMLHTFLKGRALSQFEYHLRKRLGAEDVDLLVSYLLEVIVKDVCLKYISMRAIRL
jgi:hypothetical protein